MQDKGKDKGKEEQETMSNDVKVLVPGEKRKHTFKAIEIEGQEYWYDATATAKLKKQDSVRIYRRELTKLIPGRYIRKSLFDKL